MTDEMGEQEEGGEGAGGLCSAIGLDVELSCVSARSRDVYSDDRSRGYEYIHAHYCSFPRKSPRRWRAAETLETIFHLSKGQ